MASYATVMWQPDDVVTSQKLQQMADNEQWAHDNLVSGTSFIQSATVGNAPGGSASTNNLRGRVQGVYSVDRLVTVYAAFDYSGPAVTEVSYWLSYPNIFTTAPIVVVSASTGTNPYFCYIKNDNYGNTVWVGVRHADGQAHSAWDGAINAIVAGH